MKIVKLVIGIIISIGQMPSLSAQEFNSKIEPEDSISSAYSFEGDFAGAEITLSRKNQLNDSISIQSGMLDFIGLNTQQYADSIVLRWAPSSRSLWLKANKIGYIIRRTTIPENWEPKNENDEPVTRDIVSIDHPVLPFDSTKWAPYFPTEDKYIIIAAGATMGGLEVGINQGFAIKANQDQSIYGFTLLAADLSATAANGLGLRFVDKNISIGNRYIYEVLLADSLSQVPIEKLDSIEFFKRIESNLAQQNGDIVYLGKYEAKSLIGLETISMEKQVRLKWPAYPNKDFSAYFIERSSDNGKTYDTLTHNLYISKHIQEVDSTTGTVKEFFTFTDKLEENYVPYIYRIIGYDAFAGHSPPQTVVGMGKDLTPPPNPKIKSGEFIQKEQRILINYELEDPPEDLSDLYLEYAYHIDSTFVRYESEMLDPSDSIYYHQPAPDESSHYFRMVAKDTANNSSRSFPIFVNIPDTIPPPAPTGLTGTIDDSGEVHLKWHDFHLSEKGFLGYRVYYSNHPDFEFTQLTTKPVNSNFYIYHLPLKVLTDKVYYKLQAVDKSYNHSTFSDVLELEKPDLIPPIAPVFNTPKVTSSKILLSWSLSASRDVESQYLIRKNLSEGDSTIINLAPSISSYEDSLASPGIYFEYKLKALDQGGVHSKPSFPVRARMIDKKEISPVENLKAEVIMEGRTVSLSWKYPSESDDVRFIVYRNLGVDKVKRYRLSPTIDPTYEDHPNQSGTYYYAIRAINKSGARSRLSQVISVTIN